MKAGKIFFMFAIILFCNYEYSVAKSFTDNGNGTVTDNDTNLIWQQGEGGSMSWESALTYCEGLSLGGNDDWRLPTMSKSWNH